MASDQPLELSLRPMCFEDISRVAQWFWNFEDTALFERALPIPISTQAVEESWRSALEFADPPRACWFIAEDAGGHAQGIAGLHCISYIHGDAVLPFFVAEPLRRRGLASAMAMVLLDLAFDQLRLHRVTTFYRADHRVSEKVLQRLGFSEEGRRRQGWFADGQRHDTIQVGILRSEWLEERAVIKTTQAKRAQVTVNLRRPASE